MAKPFVLPFRGTVALAGMIVRTVAIDAPLCCSRAEFVAAQTRPLRAIPSELYQPLLLPLKSGHDRNHRLSFSWRSPLLRRSQGKLPPMSSPSPWPLLIPLGLRHGLHLGVIAQPLSCCRALSVPAQGDPIPHLEMDLRAVRKEVARRSGPHHSSGRVAAHLPDPVAHLVLRQHLVDLHLTELAHHRLRFPKRNIGNQRQHQSLARSSPVAASHAVANYGAPRVQSLSYHGPTFAPLGISAPRVRQGNLELERSWQSSPAAS